jgi:DNA-binding transcriptional regulator YiaG
MICECGCKTEFEPARVGQRYVNARHRYRAHNRRKPARRSSGFPVAALDASGESQQACYHAVAESSHGIGPQTSANTSNWTPSEKALDDFRTVDDIIRREKLLTPREVAAVLGVSIQTLRTWRCRTYRRDLKFVKLAGQRVRYRLRDLQAWLGKLGVGPKADQG